MKFAEQPVFIIKLWLMAICVHASLYASTMLDLNSGRVVRVYSVRGVFNTDHS